MSRILGLDLGTNSIGWAIVDTQQDGSYKLFDKGVSIFQEGVKIEKGNESSKAAERTGYRSARRRIFRRKLRKIETLKVLVDLGWCPYLSSEQLSDWRYKDIYPKVDEFMLWQRTNDDEQKNPYYYRHLALTQKLDLSRKENRYIIGRVMYHLSQRRGFLSNRKENTKESDGKVKQDISSLNKAIEDSGCKYLGEYFYSIYGKERIRTHYTSRQNYKDEFEEVCRIQNISGDVKKRLERAVFFQRPLKSQKGSVGHCKFETRKTRCPVSHPRFEEFRMWSFINNIKVKTPYDEDMRPLNAEEIIKILPLFFRKSKKQFQFEDIAKALAARGQYAFYKDQDEKPYRFNYKMFTSVSGCPVIAGLKEIFGDNWEEGITSKYLDTKGKTKEQIVNDIWHAMFFFSDDEKLRAWAKEKLQLSEEDALKFSKIPVGNDYASLSLNAINKILAFLRRGFKYSHAVFLANISSIVPKEIISNPENRKIIEREIGVIVDNPSPTKETTEQRIKEFLMDNFDLGAAHYERLYHPSMIDVYAKSNTGFLGSPRTNSFKNPMAMRALFRLRALMNDLIKNGEIDKDTKIHIEFSRSLNDANRRKALERYQRDREKKNNEFREEIIKHFREHGIDAQPTQTDIEKYRLWEEQGHICLYTGERIALSQFLGSNSQYDIEHTIPRSLGGEDALENKTLCNNKFNRDVKKNKIPSQLSNHQEILIRLEPAKERIEELRKQIEKLKGGSAATKEVRDTIIQKRRLLEYERNYLSDKYGKFLMKEVPSDYRKNQDVDNSIISKYARPYLKTIFTHIYTVKGLTTSQFRKMWGLQEDEKKDRSTFLNHTVDAIVIACIGPKEYSEMAHYYKADEEFRWFGKNRPTMPKPWTTFTEDVQNINREVLVSHYTPDNIKKRTYKLLRKRGEIQKGPDGKPLMTKGDTARGALHLETFYGAIQRGDEIKYVVRKPLSSMEKTDVSKIVDDVVRQKVEQAIEEKGFKDAMAGPVWMNEEKGVQIKKVRIFTPSVTNPIHLKDLRDKSRFDYKQQLNVANDRNYCMGIYEGTDSKGKTKRSFKLVNNLNAVGAVNEGVSFNMIPNEDSNGYRLKYILKIGTMVLLYENTPDEIYEANQEELTRRLYKVVGLSTLIIQKKYEYGSVTLRYNQEARPLAEVKPKNGVFVQGEGLRPAISILHSQMNALVEGFDFTLSPSGKIHFIRR
ncbi:MAG: CRISPR-associated protein Csn1 [Bacteroidales bacterium]|nr:CRISPR-associated protein Csn1 [Bacteroidales bacterium]